MQVQKGEQAHLQCTALGDTPIEIMWKVGGKRIAEDMDQRYKLHTCKHTKKSKDSDIIISYFVIYTGTQFESSCWTMVWYLN